MPHVSEPTSNISRVSFLAFYSGLFAGTIRNKMGVIAIDRISSHIVIPSFLTVFWREQNERHMLLLLLLSLHLLALRLLLLLLLLPLLSLWEHILVVIQCLNIRMAI